MENTYLNLPGRHLEFFGELFAPWSIRFLVGDKDALQYLKLRGGGALACLDCVRDVCVEHLRVDFGGIHAGWNERGNVRTVASWGGCGEGRVGGIRRVAQQHNPLRGGRGRGREGEGEGEKEEKERVCLRERGAGNKGHQIGGNANANRLDYKFDFLFIFLFCLNSFPSFFSFFFPTPPKIKIISCKPFYMGKA